MSKMFYNKDGDTIMVHSLNKGKSFEREIANFLTDQTGVKWHRVPQSGAFSTVNKSEDPRFDGDVFTEDKKFQGVVIECKSNKNIVDLNMLFNRKSLFWKWVEQASSESKGKRWLLFVKITRKGTWVVSKDMQDLKSLGLLTTKSLRLTLNDETDLKFPSPTLLLTQIR